MWEGIRQRMILLSKQYSRISSDSCVPKPSLISTRGFPLASSFFFRIESTLEPLQTGVEVGVTLIGQRIIPTRSIMCRPICSVRRRRPNYHRIQIPTVSTYTFYSCNVRAFYTRVSSGSLIVLADNGFHCVRHRDESAGLIKIPHITRTYVRTLAALAQSPRTSVQPCYICRIFSSPALAVCLR